MNTSAWIVIRNLSALLLGMIKTSYVRNAIRIMLSVLCRHAVLRATGVILLPEAQHPGAHLARAGIVVHVIN